MSSVIFSTEGTSGACRRELTRQNQHYERDEICSNDERRPEALSDGQMHADSDELSQYMSFTTRALCGLYALFVVVLGLVLSLTLALTSHLDTLTYHVNVFNTYVYVVAIVAFAYVHFVIWKHGPTTASASANTSTDVTVTCQSCDAAVVTSSPAAPPSAAEPWVTFDAPGVTFYLRLGAIGFGTAVLIHDGLGMVEFAVDSTRSVHCLDSFQIVVIVLHMTFTFVQTFFVFKAHTIVVRRHKSVMRFCFAHLIATNISVWIKTTVAETQLDTQLGVRLPQQLSTRDDDSGGYDGVLLAAEEGNATSLPNDFYNASTSGIADVRLMLEVSPYLFPCVIEYSLVSAAILYKLYYNIGRPPSPVAVPACRHDTHRPAATSLDCHKANRGLFGGLILTVLTLVSITCYFVFDELVYGSETTTTAALLFFSTELLLLTPLCVAVVAATFKLRRLRFRRHADHCRLDQSLLVVAVFGVFVLETFHVVSATASDAGLVGVLSAVSSILGFAQAALQTLFIIDASNRRVRTSSQAEQKPGRALVTLLLLLNLSLWLVGILEVKKAENLPLHTKYYGYLAWSIVSHVCVPLTIFFRFHSTVCLSEIWINAYQWSSTTPSTVGSWTSTIKL